MTPAEIAERFRELEEERISREADIGKASVSIEELQHRLSSVRAAIKAEEASIWVNGGAGKVVIDGKNEKLREAQFTKATEAVPGLMAAYARLGEIEAGIETCERMITNRRSSIRGIDYAMQLCIEQFQYLNTPRFYKEV